MESVECLSPEVSENIPASIKESNTINGFYKTIVLPFVCSAKFIYEIKVSYRICRNILFFFTFVYDIVVKVLYFYVFLYSEHLPAPSRFLWY